MKRLVYSPTFSIQSNVQSSPLFVVLSFTFLSLPFHKTQASWEADKAEEERKLEKGREHLERSKSSLLSEQREQMELLYKERKDISREKSRLATASQKATEKVAQGGSLLIRHIFQPAISITCIYFQDHRLS